MEKDVSWPSALTSCLSIRIARAFLIDNNMMSFTPNDDVLFAKYLFDTIRLSRFAQVGALP